MKTVIALILFLFLPFQAICSEESPLAAIEEKILADDLDGAIRLFNSGPFILTIGYSEHQRLQAEVLPVIRYFREVVKYQDEAKVPAQEKQTIISAQYVINARNDIPKDHHFSQALKDKIRNSNQENFDIYLAAQAKVDAENSIAEQEEARAKKICGNDFDNIKVGMSLKRVNDCVGETTLTGQIQKDGVTISTYRVNSIYLHVKDGLVAAWVK